MRQVVASLLVLFSSVCHASMVWSGVAVDPKLIGQLKSDEKFLVKTILTSPKENSVDLDKAWHGIHFLLTGSAEPNGSLASKVIMGGEDIGPHLGYGPAQLLTVQEVRDIANLLQTETPDKLAARYEPAALARAGIYPDVIWEREKQAALDYVIKYYKDLITFYSNVAAKGYVVVFALH